MSITLVCVIKGSSSANAFPVDIDRNESVCDLKKAIKAKNLKVFGSINAMDLKLWKVQIKIQSNCDDTVQSQNLQNNIYLCPVYEIGDYWTENPPSQHIHVIIKLPLLSQEEALSCIPPPIGYASSCISNTTIKVNGNPPTNVLLWNDLFDVVNRFNFDEQPVFDEPIFSDGFILANEEMVRFTMDVNIFMNLNRHMRHEYKFSREYTPSTGMPDFTCHYMEKLILTIEIKIKHALKDMGEQTFPAFYKSSSSDTPRKFIQQIYNYMRENELKYSILSTYDNHWFLCRKHDELLISDTLPLKSKSPPVLKVYAYLAQQAKCDHYSSNPNIPMSVRGDNNSRILRSSSKLSENQQPTSNTSSISDISVNQQLSSGTSINQRTFDFSDFKFKSILGIGRSGKTLLCKFRSDEIALKSADFSKTPSNILEEMKKEVEVYKNLADIQGKYIPKLVCYGYYGGGMSFVIGLNHVGTPLSHHKITDQQISRACKALKAIHDHGILHNDIREENILVNNNGDIYLIDFGMAIREDLNKKRKLFDEEQDQLSCLLNRYHITQKPFSSSPSSEPQAI
ncbi:hypothetical protein Glove_151g129 [Diversispora epigaea]|uniref:Protein kinase domain-containing protein n=1 Tax=Diversispora epigaea TaxID=1348612 RepID=A0A397IVS7_9GLOM|nr:hypothetical protein Glove_151g129 [Diversispora epigaea]